MKKTVLTIVFQLILLLSVIGQDSIKLIEFSPSECLDELSLTLIQKRIVSQVITNNTLEIEVATWTNCALGTTGTVKMDRNTLILETKGNPRTFEVMANGDTLFEEMEVADCDCCFHFKFKIEGITTLPKYVIINGDSIQQNDNTYLPPKYVVINGDSLIQTDSEGFFYQYFFYDSQKIRATKKSKGGY